MYKIALVDDDECWCFAVKSVFEKSFEVTTFERIPYCLHKLVEYDLVIVNYSMASAESDEVNISRIEGIRFLKTNFVNPPLLIISTPFRGMNNVELPKKICPQADAFFDKESGLEELFNQTQMLLASKKKRMLEPANLLIHAIKPMYTMAVVDDDRHWCFVLERFFKNEFEVYTFPTAADLVKQVFDFDLVIVDYSIPHLHYEEYMESREFIRYLKNLPYPPLVMLVTGYVSKNDSALGEKICPEADAFCAKDAGLDELYRKIKELLSCKR